MFAVTFLFEGASKNLLSDFVPESIGLLISGAVLIAPRLSEPRFQSN